MAHKCGSRMLAIVMTMALIVTTVLSNVPMSVKASGTDSTSSDFVTTNGTKFWYQGKEFGYSGTNCYYVNFKSKKDAEKLFAGAERMGINVLRTWGNLDAGVIQKGQTNNGKQVFQDSADGSGEKDGVYYQYFDPDKNEPVINEGENGLEHLDYCIAQAKEHNVKLIITFTNSWIEFGGMPQYVKWAGESDHDLFYTDEKIKGWYKNYVKTLLNRTNKYTGVKYKDDPTIFSWELANEPRADTDQYAKENILYNWVEEMSAYVKSIDSNHMVSIGDEGFANYEYNSPELPDYSADPGNYIWHGSNGVDYQKLITCKNIDFGTPHLYIKDWNMGQFDAKKETEAWIRWHAEVTHEVKKPVILEEFGFNKEKEGLYFSGIEEFFTWMYDKLDTYGYAGNNFWMLADYVEADGDSKNVPYKNYDGFNIYSCSYEDVEANPGEGYDLEERKNQVKEREPVREIIIERGKKVGSGSVTTTETSVKPTTTENVTTTQATKPTTETTVSPTTETTVAPTTEAPVVNGDSIILDSFDTYKEGSSDEVNGWKGEKGYSYNHGGAENGGVAETAYSKEQKALAVTLDYSKNSDSNWSEAKISKTYSSNIDLSGKKYIGYTVTYPAELDGSYKAKFFAESVNGDNKIGVIDENGIIYDECKSYDKETGLYKVLAYAPIKDGTKSFNKLSLGLVGSETDFKGQIFIDDIRLFDTLPVYEPPEEGLVYLLDDFSKCKEGSNGEINNWKPLNGWQYNAGKANGTGQEQTTISYDKERKALKVDLDYSLDSDKSWSEAKINTWMDQKGIDISKTNQIRFDVTYPKEFDGFGVKIFANNYTLNNGAAIIEAEATMKDKVDNGDGTMTATVKVGYMKGIETPLNSICIGFVGKYSDFKGSIYVDNAEIWAVDTGVALPKVETPGASVDISKMPSNVLMADSKASKEAAAAYSYLKAVAKDKKVLFGHQNDNSRTVAGGESDTKDITGSISGVVAYDSLAITGSELGVTTDEGLAKTVASSKEAAKQGALISISTHLPNFATMKKEGSSDFSKYGFESSKDLSGNCAESILPGKECNSLYNQYLDIIVKYAKQMEGTPIIFRPLHENNGGWFWWGSSCTAETYKALYRYTVDYLLKNGVHNFIYEYSPNGPIMTEDQFLARYPGDDYVDVLAFDYYDDYAEGADKLNESFFDNLDTSCKVIKKLADERDKVAVIAEAGVRVTKASGDSNGLLEEDNPITGKDWYNKVNDVAADNGMSYFLLWANFSNQNFYVPYLVDVGKCHELGPDFVKFYNNKTSVFADGTNLKEALEKSVDVSGYTDVSGYMVDPVNFQEIEKPVTFTANVKNADKVEYVIYRDSKDTDPVRVEAKKNSSTGMYEAQITDQILEQIGKVEIANVALEGDGTQVALAKYVSFGTTKSKAPAGTIDNFDYYYGDAEYLESKYCGSNSAGGCSSSIALAKRNAKDGTYSGKFSYSLTHSGSSESWTGVGRALEVTDYSKDAAGNETNAISMWVSPDGKGQKFVFQVISGGFEFEAFLTDFMKGNEAQYVTIPFSALKPKVSGKVFNPANVTQMYFYCNSIAGSDAYEVSSDIYLDKIKVIKADTSKIANVPLGGYVLSDTQLDGEEDTPIEEVRVTGVTLSETAKVKVGNSIYLKAEVMPEDATNDHVEWSSDNEEIATVDKNGKVIGVSEGEAEITVKTEDGGFTAKCKVTVEKKEVKPDPTTEVPATTEAPTTTEAPVTTEGPAPTTEAPVTTEAPATTETPVPTTEEPTTEAVAVTGVKLDKSAATKKVGEILTLKATVQPENATDTSVRWESSDESVATVKNGIVKLLKEGTVKITVITNDGNKKAECNITVNKKQDTEEETVEKVLVTPASLDLMAGEEATLEAEVLPETLENRNVVWESSNEEIAVVNPKTGKVTAKKAGIAVITAYSEKDNKMKAECTVTVKEILQEKEPVTSAILNTDKVSITQGEQTELVLSVLPQTAIVKETVWESSNPEVAEVEEGKIKALKPGTAVITVTVKGKDGGIKKAECEVTVTEKEAEKISVTGIELDKTLLEMKPGDSEKLIATVFPQEATDKEVIFKSMDSKVAVYKNGKVIAFGEGTTVITATTKDGGFTARCVVIVKKEAEPTTEEPGTEPTTEEPTTEPTTEEPGTKPTTEEPGKQPVAGPPTAAQAAQQQSSVPASDANHSSKNEIALKKVKAKKLKKKKVSSSKVKLTWKKESKAKYYEVWLYRSDKKKYRVYKVTKKNSITVKKLKKKYKYKFKVYAYVDKK